MCYHVSIPRRKEIDELFNHTVVTHKWDTSYNHLSGFSFAEVPVITAQQPQAIELMHWGLIPSWVKTQEQARQSRMNCLNAKSETLFEKPSFRMSINQRRCLMPVNGFYEWREVNKKKYPYFIYFKEQTAFCLAGIYDEWLSRETGELIKTMSVVTTQANSLMEQIHNLKQRMPLILSKETMHQWIDPTLNEQQIKSLMQPLDSKYLEAHTISNKISGSNSNVPEVKIHLEYPELTWFDSLK